MNILRFFATTVAFLLAATGITIVLWAISTSGYELVPGHQVQNWLQQGTVTVAYAAMAGLLIDALRMFGVMSAQAFSPRHGQGGRKHNLADACLAD